MRCPHLRGPISHNHRKPVGGEYGATPRWNLASLSGKRLEKFGQDGSVYEEIVDDSARRVNLDSEDQIIVKSGLDALLPTIDQGMR
jgi:hypothetical protein